MDIIYLLTGLCVGGFISWLIMHFYVKSKNPISKEEAISLRNQQQDLDVKLQVSSERLKSYEEEVMLLRKDLESEREKALKYSTVLAGRNEELKNLNEKLETQKADIEKLQEKFQIQFKNLANEILDEKTKKFTDQNKLNLSDILNPLKEKISEFEKKVEQTNNTSL